MKCMENLSFIDEDFDDIILNTDADIHRNIFAVIRNKLMRI